MKVFVSYSSKDHAKVAPLVEKLEGAGVDVWIDEKRLAGGQPLWPEIRIAIEDNEWFITVLSENSLGSDWFHKEVRHAFTHKREKTIPVLVSKALELVEFPKWLAELHAPLISEPEKILKAIEFDRYENLLSRGRNHFREKRYMEAVRAYDGAIARIKSLPRDPTRDSTLFIELSRVYHAAGDMNQAVVAATKAIESSNSASAYLQRAECAFKKRDIEIAIEDFRSCLGLDPRNARALNGLGVAMFQQNPERVVEIAKIFKQAIACCDAEQDSPCLNSLKLKLQKHLGMVLEKQALIEPNRRQDVLLECAKCFRLAVQLDPSDFKARFSLAYTEHRLGNLASAIEHYKQIDAEVFMRVSFCLGYAHFELEKYMDALEVFRRGKLQFRNAEEISSCVGCMVGEARSLLKLRRFVEAVRVAEEAYGLANDDIRVQVVLAESNALKGETAKAIVVAKRVAEQKCARASEILANVYGTDTSDGRKHAEDAAKIRGDEVPGIWRSICGIRQTLNETNSSSFEPAEVIDAERSQSICHLKKWKCGNRCCW